MGTLHRLPRRAPPEGGNSGKDFVIATLCKPCTTAKLANEAARSLVDNLVGSITTQAILDHTTSDDLDDEENEENEVTTSRPPPPPPQRGGGGL